MCAARARMWVCRASRELTHGNNTHLVAAARRTGPLHLLETPLAFVKEVGDVAHIARDLLLLVIVVAKAGQQCLAGKRLQLCICVQAMSEAVKGKTCQRGADKESTLLILICEISRFISSTRLTHTGGTL